MDERFVYLLRREEQEVEIRRPDGHVHAVFYVREGGGLTGIATSEDRIFVSTARSIAVYNKQSQELLQLVVSSEKFHCVAPSELGGSEKTQVCAGLR